MDDREVTSLYWRCCVDGGQGEFAEDKFVEAVKAWCGEVPKST